MKLWHDDIRRPPDTTWTWVRTNGDAKVILDGRGVEPREDIYDHVTTISLDHDLGLHDLDPDTENAIYMIGQGKETGYDLVLWMIVHDIVPARVYIHSMNSVGAARMKNAIAAAARNGGLGRHVTLTVEPYRA